MTAHRNSGETDSRKALCCLLVLEIADYEAKPVFDQIRLTQDLRQVLSDATAHAGADDVVSIVREQGAVLGFLADPEECFSTALAIREATLNQHRYRDLPLRIGINLGSVEFARDEFGHAYVSGSGRRDAERVMNQGPPRQLSVTRTFFEVLSRAAPELAGALEYQGVFSDTLGPPLGLYRLSAPHGGQPLSPSIARATIAHPSAQPTPVLSRASPEGSRQAVRPATNEARRVRRLQLRYVVVPLLLGAVIVASSSRFRVEVAASMPAPQLAAAVAETPMPRADAPPAGLPVATPPAAGNTQTRSHTASRSASEKRVRTGSAMPRREQPPVPASDRTARLEPSQEQETRLEPSQEQEKKPDRSAEAKEPPLASEAATLVLAVKPWGEVYVDGRHIGVTPPLKRFQVAPGRRFVTIKNSSLPEYRIQLTVDPNAELTVAHDFSCTPNRERRCWEEISKGLASRSPFRFKTVEAEPRTALR